MIYQWCIYISKPSSIWNNVNITINSLTKCSVCFPIHYIPLSSCEACRHTRPWCPVVAAGHCDWPLSGNTLPLQPWPVTKHVLTVYIWNVHVFCMITWWNQFLCFECSFLCFECSALDVLTVWLLVQLEILWARLTKISPAYPNLLKGGGGGGGG
jgi:hypothetical protein